MPKDRALIGTAVLVFALAACGGGGGGVTSVPPAPGTGSGGQLSAVQQQQDSVAAANAAGAPVEDVSSIETGVNNPLTLSSAIRSVAATATATTAPCPAPTAGASPCPSPTPRPVATPLPNGTCTPNFFSSGPFAGFAYWKPDKAGDPNSVEYQFFYDAACTQLGRDTVRVVSSVSGTGTVKTQTHTVTTTEYDKGSSTASSIRKEINTITGQFDAEGYPLLKLGFARASVLTVTEGGTVVESRSGEHIAGPTSTSAQTYCGDSAGFNNLKLTSTGQVHGWQNLTANATRTVNADGSVTWTDSSSGSVFSGASAGALSIASGSLNSACPISVPAFTLAGGTLVSSYNVPSMSVTFKSGSIVNLTVTNATLANGYTYNITTDATQPPASSKFINGTISKGATVVATFGVDANGNGTLTVTATGAQFTLDHWHVVKDKPAAPPSPSPTPTASPAPGTH